MLSNNSIAVFWHRDSCTMNLVLSYLKKKNFKPIVVVITADPRGDYIEAAIKKFGAESIRIDFNAFDVKEYKNLKEIIYVFLTIFLYLLKCPQSLIL